MATLCMHGRYSVSVTDQACVWNAPKPSTVDSNMVKTIQEIYKPTKVQFCKTPQYASFKAIDEFIASLDENVYFAWLLKKEDSTPQNMDLLVSIEDILFSEEYLRADNKANLLLQ